MPERGSADRLRLALEASGRIGTWEWDLTTDTVTGDERTAHLYGVDPQLAADGAPAAAFIVHVHPADYRAVSAQFHAAYCCGERHAAGGRPGRVLRGHRRYDHPLRPVLDQRPARAAHRRDALSLVRQRGRHGGPA